MSRSTRQLLDGIIQARNTGWAQEFTNISDCARGALDWFFEEIPHDDRHPKFDFRGKLHIENKPPYRERIVVGLNPHQHRLFRALPDGKRGRIFDAILATWLTHHIPPYDKPDYR